MNFTEFTEIVIKDGNRTVNWMFPPSSKISYILDQWEKNYFPCNRKRVIIDNKRVVDGCLDCQLNYFKSFGKKIVMRLETVYPKKEKGAEQNG